MRTVQEGIIGPLRYAIENRKQVSAVIRNLPRVFCPHILGTKGLRWHIVAWQFDGFSTMGDLPNWRRFEVDQITNLQIVDGQWHRGFSRTAGPRKFAFDLVEAIADSEYLGNIRVVAPSLLGWTNYQQAG
jgi:predicted DNA-binding transcriptional regulator YafY